MSYLRKIPLSPRLKIWIVRAGIGLLALLVFATTALFIILSTQQERIVNMAVANLNQNLKGELVVENSQISLFRNFPDASIVLHNGKFFADKRKQGLPIYEFDRLYIAFKIGDLLRQNYNVRGVELDGGYLSMVEEKDGKINLIEAESPQEDKSNESIKTGDGSTMSLDLKKIIIRNLNVSFHDKATGNRFNTRIANLTSSVQMDTADVIFGLNGAMKLDVKTDKDTVLFRDKNFQLNIFAKYGLRSKEFVISTCNFKLEEAGFHVSGHASFADTTELNFRVKGEKQDFSLFTAFLPAHVKDDLKPFQYDGRIHFDGSIKGKVTTGQAPFVQLQFGCDDAWFLNKEANRKVDKLGFKGYFTNGHERSLKTSEIHIMNMNARPEKGIFKGHFVVRDFTNPQAVVQINSELELKFIGEFLGIADLKQTTGTIKLEMDFKELHDIQLPEESLNKLKEGIQSRLSIKDLSFRIPGYPYPVTDMNIIAEMKDGRVTVDSAMLTIGDSDLEVSGTVSDLRAFIRERDKLIDLTLNVSSRQLLLDKLLAYDSALGKKFAEEIHAFNVSMKLQTTPNDLLNPSPLPRGTFELRDLQGKFKNYPHTLKDIGATVTINDTLLRVRDFTGMIDSSDVNFKGRITNYHLWFDDIKKGKTQIAFDLKSNRFAFRDVFSRDIRQYLPRGYRREELRNVWLRAKFDLRYDTIFRFMKGRLANVTAELKNHKLKLTEISGGVKYGSKILGLDTLRGKIGNSDFDISMKYYFKGIDRYNNKVANSLKFKSNYLDLDEMSQYDLEPKARRTRKDSLRDARMLQDTATHAKAFNIFIIPFSDFNSEVVVNKIKYNGNALSDFTARIAMRADQTISIDTLTVGLDGGLVGMNGKFNGSNHQKIFLQSKIVFQGVDMENILLKFDHFGDDVVLHKSVKGKVSGLVSSYVQVHPDLVPIMSNTHADINVKIYNGSLVEFGPMLALGTYFKDKNLHRIRFDTLENKLKFVNGILEIPTMDINSSLGYIQLSGKQSLDMHMEYYLRVPMKIVTKAGLGSILNRKPEEVDLEQIDEIDYDDKDKTLAFMNLKITGTPDNYKVGLGKSKGKKTL